MYCNWQSTFENLTDEEAGKLIKHLFSYVNDNEPVSSNRLINVVFEPLKAVLKSDLQKYEKKREKNAENIRKRWNKNDTTVYGGISSYTNHTDNGNDNVNDNGNVNDKDNISDIKIIKEIDKEKAAPTTVVATPPKKKNITDRENEFYNSVAAHTAKYEKEMLRAFFDYWSEKNAKGDKMRFELQRTFEISKRLATWERNNSKFEKTENGKSNKPHYIKQREDNQAFKAGLNQMLADIAASDPN